MGLSLFTLSTISTTWPLFPSWIARLPGIKRLRGISPSSQRRTPVATVVVPGVDAALHPLRHRAAAHRSSRRTGASLRVVRTVEAGLPAGCSGRMMISGRISDVCAELDRLAAIESRQGHLQHH